MTENKLGDYLARVRRSKKLSFPDIKRQGGPSLAWLSSTETGQNIDRPKRDTLEKLAIGLGVPLAEVLEAAGELLSEDAPPPRPPNPLNILPGRITEKMTDWEREVLNLMYEADMGHGVLMTPDFWMDPPEVRARFLTTVENGAQKAIETKKRIADRNKEAGR